jgi:hypothetical protein
MRLAALLLAACAATAGAQPRALLLPDGAKLAVDGRLDEAAWRDAPVHDRFRQFLPTDGVDAPAAYRTTVQVVAEEHALVIGVRAFDPRPAEIRAPLVRRDQVKREQDFVAVILDPVGDRRAAQFVRVSAAGVIADGTFVAATDTEDFAPDYDVEAAVVPLPDGWSVEVRLPLLALRYPRDGALPWRLMVTRSIPRASSMLMVSAPLTKEALNFIAELQPIEGLEAFVERARTHAIAEVRPELTVRGTRTRGPGGSTRDDEASLGVDLKWRPRADWVFDATIRPDFSQVELDTPQLAGNTRFALSVPEKRPFFLESSDVLDLPIGAWYSRSVTDPSLGLRATWRGARGDGAGLLLRDQGGGLILLPRAYATDIALQDDASRAALVRGRAHLAQASVGLIASTRDYERGGSNRVAGADVEFRSADGQQQSALRVLRSQTSALFGDDGSARVAPAESATSIEAKWRARIPGWNLLVKAWRTGAGYRNDNGFVDQAGVRAFETEIIRRWGEVAVFGEAGFDAYEFETYGWLQRVETLPDERHGVAGGELVAQQFHPGIWLVAARNTEAWVQLQIDRQRVRPGGTLHGLEALAFHWQANPAPWLPLVLFETTIGRRLDVEADRTGRGVAWEAEAVVRGSAPNGWGLESQQRIEQGWVAAPDGRRAFTDTAGQWIGVVHFSARQSLRLVAQAIRFSRRADAGAGLGADRFSSDTRSVVWQHRAGLGRSLSVGATRARTVPDGTRQTEVFAKAAWAW